ncbi:LPS assembly lipoprotein LptE [Kaistia algarum]|uniref:LPS assembly lipoprotein LptE n=1 Tax=Kaistia algarum TaxID=2083279 RepID=UPI002257C888|nr:LPS assembly lipoprotein LptE [Kaistia algarum]MCX5513870.1 LPS assembly lipoprotein LptE [Kaistia algarum]
MSSSDRHPDATRHPTRRGAVLMFATLAMLAGCTVRPVYMPVAGNQFSSVDLSMISVVGGFDRVGQEVRNNLVFIFTGGRTPPPPKYTLNIEVKNSESRLGFTTDSLAPAYQVSIEVKFEVKTIADDRVLIRSSSIGLASYNRSNQSFANERARIDAENRAAKSVADEINLRIALAIAKDKPPAPVYVPKGPNLPPGATPEVMSNNMQSG